MPVPDRGRGGRVMVVRLAQVEASIARLSSRANIKVRPGPHYHGDIHQPASPLDDPSCRTFRRRKSTYVDSILPPPVPVDSRPGRRHACTHLHLPLLRMPTPNWQTFSQAEHPGGCSGFGLSLNVHQQRRLTSQVPLSPEVQLDRLLRARGRTYGSPCSGHLTDRSFLRLSSPLQSRCIGGLLRLRRRST